MQVGNKAFRRLSFIGVMILLLVIMLVPATVFAGTASVDVGSASFEKGGSASRTMVAYNAPGDPGTGGSTIYQNEADTEEATARTVAEYEVPEGSAYIVGDEENTFENTHEKNAIQAAIDAAIAGAKNSITVVVNNGVYEGGINVINTDASRDITLRIIANDAIEDGFEVTTQNEAQVKDHVNAGSAGGAAMQGDINLEGISTLIAGIYLSMQDQIKAKGADELKAARTSMLYFTTSQRKQYAQ